MRQGGLTERLTARERGLAVGMKLTFAVHRDSPSLMIMFCNCQVISKLPVKHLCVVNHVCTSSIWWGVVVFRLIMTPYNHFAQGRWTYLEGWMYYQYIP